MERKEKRRGRRGEVEGRMREEGEGGGRRKRWENEVVVTQVNGLSWPCVKVKVHLDDIGEHRIVAGEEDDTLLGEESTDDL